MSYYATGESEIYDLVNSAARDGFGRIIVVKDNCYEVREDGEDLAEAIEDGWTPISARRMKERHGLL